MGKIINAAVFLIIMLMLINTARAQDFYEERDYSIAKINPKIIGDAGAVVRLNRIEFTVIDGRRAYTRVRQAVTILNKTEQHNGELQLWYGKFTDIEDLEGKIYDAFGEEVAELDDNHIKDYSAFSDYTLYEDTRVKLAELYYNTYPYTVEFIYEIAYDGYINWPSWYSQNYIYPVEENSLEVIAPKGYKLRYWSNQNEFEPIVHTDGRNSIYKWGVQNLPQLPREVLNQDIEDIVSIVKIAPHEFEIEGYKGNMSSWKDFGLWFYKLAEDKRELPESAKNDIKSLIKDEDDVKVKIDKLYKYMQSRTRYVSVQLGIGGWQPFPAQYVSEKGYGDCKALSNYMVALLENCGIDAYHVLINSGDDRYPLISEFPSNQFNHVVVCVPLKQDTVWLECTSQTKPTGQIGYWNENREALLITSEGGIIIQSPKSKSEENIQTRKINAAVSKYGNINADILMEWKGTQNDPVINAVDVAGPLEREKWILKMLEVPDVKLNNFFFEGIESKLGEIKLSLKIDLPKYASAAGNRIFFKPNIMERKYYIPKDMTDRKSPIRFNFPYTDMDSVYFSIPIEYKVEAKPEEIFIENSFGKFHSKVELVDDQNLLFIRWMEIKDYSIPPEFYSEYRSFLSEVVKADRSQIVLVKK